MPRFSMSGSATYQELGKLKQPLGQPAAHRIQPRTMPKSIYVFVILASLDRRRTRLVKT
jgi:hypothetical protein